MAYTFTHPGFVIYLKRKWPKLFNTAGLVMGSIVPDLDIIFRLSYARHHIFNYSFENILFQIVPLGILMSVFTHIAIIPALRKRRPELSIKNLLKIPIFQICVSCVIAIVIHLQIDKWTHLNANDIVHQIDLKTHISIEYLRIIFYTLMYGPPVASSLLGGILLYKYVGRRNISVICRNIFHSNNKPAIIVSVCVFIITTLAKYMMTGLEDGFLLDSIVILLTSSALITLFIYPILFYGHTYFIGQINKFR
jgi:hypothetical protein